MKKALMVFAAMLAIFAADVHGQNPLTPPKPHTTTNTQTNNARRRQEAEARRRQEEEARRRQEAEARRRQEAEARRRQEEEARRRQEEEARRRQEEEARRKQEAEARRKKSGIINGHEWVDLGLSVKWATCNVGATTPEEYGNYYAWGETLTKPSYTDSNSLTYGKSGSELRSAGIINSQGILTRNYDAASANWGGSWRMPTEAEFDELVKKCQWEWTSMNGKNGYKVTGPNGKSIFLSSAGNRTDTSLYDAGEYGRYWSATVTDGVSNAYGLCFLDGNHGTDWGYRDDGRPVRAVAE